MVRDGCKHCEQRTTNNRLCNRCQTLERHDFVTDTTPTADDTLEYRCISCGHKYTAAGSEPCPECSVRHRRYIGPLPDEHSDDRELATDGGTTSKYVVPTGSGYLGTYTVSPDSKVMISTAALGDQDWTTDTVHATTHEDGVAIVPPSESTDPLAEYTLCTRYNGARIAAGHAVVDKLDLTPDDNVRVYDLATTDDRDGLLLVDADDDPRVATDGGTDTTPDHDLELTLEYTTINDRQRRITIVPDTGGEAWRITHEIRNGEWRETGREPISELTIDLNSTENSEAITTEQRRHTVDELLNQRGEDQ